MDYRDHKPELNRMVFVLLASGIGLRQTARIVGMHRENLAKKFRKIGRHCRLLNRNLLAPLPDRSTLVFDELETYESRRNTRPLTLPIAVDRETRLILDALSNGLSYVIDRMKGQPLYAHVTLEKGERSELAELASALL
jgi:hypothetical protein